MRIVIFIVIILVFGLSSWIGYSAGVSAARGEKVVSWVSEYQKGLEVFLGEMGRYPDSRELADTVLMRDYFTTYPVPNLNSGFCPSSFVYKILGESRYQLDLCLEREVGQYIKGLNRIK